MYTDFHFYIDFNWEDCIQKSPDVYFQELFQLVELAYQHKAAIFYSSKHLKEFRDFLEIDIDENFSASVGNMLDVILENAEKTQNVFYSFEVCFANENTSLHHINNVLSCIEIHDKIAVISLSNNIESFLSVKSNLEYNRIKCKKINFSNDIIEWISTAEPRIFNSSRKHGENGIGNQKGQSVLRCSKDEAQQYLNKAVPCFSEREDNLFYYDNKHNTFIIFYYEGNNPQKQWHGFHLDLKDWDKIPNFIHKYFQKSTLK